MLAEFIPKICTNWGIVVVESCMDGKSYLKTLNNVLLLVYFVQVANGQVLGMISISSN